MLIAWNIYKSGEEYKNSLKWAALEGHREGSMWAAFAAGYESVQIPLDTPEHTLQEDFEHFLSYSGMWQESDEVKSKLLIAYEESWTPTTQLTTVHAMLREWEEAYSTDIFGEVSKEETEQYGSLVSRNSAAMGRFLVSVLRRKLSGVTEESE